MKLELVEVKIEDIAILEETETPVYVHLPIEPSYGLICGTVW